MGKRVSKATMSSTELQRMLNQMSGRYTHYEIFMDWIELVAISISNSLDAIHGDVWCQREEEYKRIFNKYEEKEINQFYEMLGWLVDELETNPRDVLGEAFMKSGLGSDSGGQFFTPFHVSKLLASLGIDKPEDTYMLNEPSCGSGGSIIAAALELQKQGINYQNTMKVICQDLDWRCVYMCYVQLSLLGIDAVCVQGDTLCDPYHEGFPERQVLKTPKHMGVLW